MKRQNVRTLALIVVTFTYLLVGAAIFDALESAHEEKQKIEMDSLQDEYIKKYNINAKDFDEIFKLVLKMKPLKAGTQWKFAGAFYFATTVITTIGYGHSTPKTTGGKIFCMIYALPGIPLTIVMFQSIGERMNICITCFLQFLKHRISKNSSKISQTKLILISSNFVSLVILFGAFIFQNYEDWTFFNSVYYCFITLTTIGFGDLVALQKNDYIAKRPDYVAFSLIFILFGLTVVSSVMNLLVLRFLTMNTEDECRDEFEAVVHAIDQHREYNNKPVYKSIGVDSAPKIQSKSFVNHGVSDLSSDMDCSCFCLQSKSPRLWITSIQNINNKRRCILTRSCLHKKDKSRQYIMNSKLKIPLQWTVKSNQNRFENQGKHYTVTRAPAIVRHLAEGGILRHYQCSPPEIKINQVPIDSLVHTYDQNNFEHESSSSNICENELLSGQDWKFLNTITECRRRRYNTL